MPPEAAPAPAAALPRTVSIVVPCRNERRHIAAFCDSALGQALPDGWRLELVVADGASDDGTRALLAARAVADHRVRIVDNPRRIVSCGLNSALAQVAGEVIVRMDVHTEYAADYVAECLAALAATGADNVGGPWHAQPEAGAGATQRAVAAAFQSRWVAGGALSRQLGYDGWVDTVYLGCWPRATFDRFGSFDEDLVRNQDDEHNLRISRGGGRIWQSSRIRSVYRPRARLAQVLRQYLQYGYWKPFVMRKHGQAASWRHLVPGGFVAALAVAAAAAVFGVVAPLGLLVGAYGVLVAALSVAVVSGGGGGGGGVGVVDGRSSGGGASGDGDGSTASDGQGAGRRGNHGRAAAPRLGAAAAWRVPAVIALYHVGYGAGTLLGSWDALLRRGRGRERFAALSR